METHLIWRELGSGSSTATFTLRGINNADACVIARELEDNATVTTLYLGENDISDVGAQALADMLQKNTTLRKLYLQRNFITDVGAKALAESLENNTTLIHLNLMDNWLTIKSRSVFPTPMFHHPMGCFVKTSIF
jgi:Ran GTPase-activating protein (RanGAP) involved in mRNA processing and transport